MDTVHELKHNACSRKTSDTAGDIHITNSVDDCHVGESSEGNRRAEASTGLNDITRNRDRESEVAVVHNHPPPHQFEIAPGQKGALPPGDTTPAFHSRSNNGNALPSDDVREFPPRSLATPFGNSFAASATPLAAWILTTVPNQMGCSCAVEPLPVSQEQIQQHVHQHKADAPSVALQLQKLNAMQHDCIIAHMCKNHDVELVSVGELCRKTVSSIHGDVEVSVLMWVTRDPKPATEPQTTVMKVPPSSHEARDMRDPEPAAEPQTTVMSVHPSSYEARDIPGSMLHSAMSASMNPSHTVAAGSLKSIGIGGQFQYRYCNKDFKHESTKRRHEKEHGNAPQNFSDRVEAGSLGSIGINGRFQCKYCPKDFKHESTKCRHEKEHCDDPYFCPKVGCSQFFRRRDSLIRHLRLMHGQKVPHIVRRKEPFSSQKIPKAVALYDFDAEAPDTEELAFKTGDTIEIVEENAELEREGWCWARIKGQHEVGLAPLDYMRKEDEEESRGPSVDSPKSLQEYDWGLGPGGETGEDPGMELDRSEPQGRTNALESSSSGTEDRPVSREGQRLPERKRSGTARRVRIHEDPPLNAEGRIYCNRPECALSPPVFAKPSDWT